MKKFIPTAVVCCLLSVVALASVRSVRLASPGTFSSEAPLEEFVPVDTLRISGPFSVNDLTHLRILCGRTPEHDSLECRVGILDLSDALFTASSDTVSVLGEYRMFISADRVIPAFAFFSLPLRNVILPQQLDSIGSNAFCYNDIDSLFIPDGVRVDWAAIAGCPSLRSLRLPDMKAGILPVSHMLPALRSVRYGDIDMVWSGAFTDLKELEEVTFDGRINHVDGYLFRRCPKLKRVVFNGPILSTGGALVAEDCPELELFEFNGLVPCQGLVATSGCSKFNSFSGRRPYLGCSDSTVALLTAADIAADNGLRRQLIDLADIQMYAMAQREPNMKQCAYQVRDMMDSVLRAVGETEVAMRLDSVAKANEDPDMFRSKLEILRMSAPYKAEPERTDIKFHYAPVSDSILALDRAAFNIDSIAGHGTDVERIKNLLYWVHDLVRHDGGSGWPDCRYNLRELVKVCREEDRGLNCRFMAEMLAEALLANGIPARYVTCMPKAYDTDGDCHVICVAWAGSLGKWVWVDPTFAAYVTDENGLMLHPGEVRERLISGAPLVLNEDANWNHRYTETKDHYLDHYMAKNLYLLQCNTRQQAEAEGKSDHPQGVACTLVPEGFSYPYSRISTTDDTLFWSAP